MEMKEKANVSEVRLNLGAKHWAPEAAFAAIVRMSMNNLLRNAYGV
jgi:hypothetical protein